MEAIKIVFLGVLLVLTVLFQVFKLASKPRKPSREVGDSPFEKAAHYVGSHDLKLTTEQQLEFYGLFKQGNVGDCDIKEPSRVSIASHAKWTSWMSVKGLSMDQAKEEYIGKLTSIAPSWATEDPGSAPPARGGGGGMGARVSTMAVQEEEIDRESLFELTAAGEVDAVMKALSTKKVDLTAKDDMGCTLLHWAADRGHVHLVSKIIEKGGNVIVDILDDDESTPLHLAVISEQVETIKVLLSHGADTGIKDSDGATPIDVCEDDEIMALLQL